MKNLKITFNSPIILGFAGISLIATILNYVTLGISNELVEDTGIIDFRSGILLMLECTD